MSNDNTTPLITAFDLQSDGGYLSAVAGPFNQASVAGEIQAFVTFVLTDQFFSGDSPTPQFLWGNLDADNNAGWAFDVADVGGQAALRARLGTNGGVVTASAPLTDSVGGPAPNACGRLIQAILLVVASTYAFLTLAADLLNAALDPRIRTR